MKLYVKSKSGDKIYLKQSAPTRRYLAKIIGSPIFIINNEEFHVNKVNAESEYSNTIAGAIIGGILGLIGGPIGAITGTTIGGIIGNSTDSEDIKRVSIFNNSYYVEKN